MDQLSVVIITKNEEAALGRCLRSLPSPCEIIILDSLSSDKTKEVALTFGAHFHSRPFTNYAEQKNAAVALATKPWVLSLDADEELTPELAQTIELICAAPPANCLYRLRRELVFMNRRMHYGKSADRPIRLGPKKYMRFHGAVHESIPIANECTLKNLGPGSILHHSYYDLSDYFSKFNDYTSKIAHNNNDSGRELSLVRVVLRPWSEFFVRYFLRLGFLDGYPGYCYALISSFYTFIKHAKLLEFKNERPSPQTKN